MNKDEKKLSLQQASDAQELEDEEEMKRTSLMNPPVPCGREEDRFGK